MYFKTVQTPRKKKKKKEEKESLGGELVQGSKQFNSWLIQRKVKRPNEGKWLLGGSRLKTLCSKCWQTLQAESVNSSNLCGNHGVTTLHLPQTGGMPCSEQHWEKFTSCLSLWPWKGRLPSASRALRWGFLIVLRSTPVSYECRGSWTPNHLAAYRKLSPRYANGLVKSQTDPSQV